MITKILVATDGSKTAMKSVKYAADLARQTGAKIIVLSVVDRNYVITQSIPAVSTPTHITESVEDYMRHAAEAYLSSAEKLCKKKGVETKTVVRSGHPVEQIVREARKSKVDLIVMGSHGKSAIESAVLGSVTYGVIHNDTRIPVLVTRM
ncbi:MAG: universal stress protein [Candidatus Sulfobium sp.]|jgi:nucleotide-binding universal stress UspA family protein